MVIAFRDLIVNHFTSLASLCLPFFTYIMSSIHLVTLTISFLHITCIYKLQGNNIMYIHVGQPPNRSLPSKKASAMGRGYSFKTEPFRLINDFRVTLCRLCFSRHANEDHRYAQNNSSYFMQPNKKGAPSAQCQQSSFSPVPPDLCTVYQIK
ncbi:Uncharacterised protein [Paenibacillus thiaminolyticus]|nr:Uncharacterised protein [Paenibacillus thiaminolyticus]